MKPAKEFANEFCNKHVISTRENVMEDFVKSVQADARAGVIVLSEPEQEYANKIAGQDDISINVVLTQAIRIYQLFREDLLVAKERPIFGLEELY